MLFILSPAKTLDFETPLPPALLAQATAPLFEDRSALLVALLRRKSPRQIARLMDLSDTLAELNVARYAAWTPGAAPPRSRPALRAFAGDVYEGLDAATLAAAELRWAQQHLVLLSGLYGALRPLDLIQPHRLEMGTALRSRQGRDLYAFWGDRIAAHLNERLAGAAAPVLVNLASVEYARAALRPSLQARVIDVQFEDWKTDRYKVISFFAKRARGLFARWAVQQRLADPARLADFAADGYALDAAASVPDRLVFRRRLG